MLLLDFEDGLLDGLVQKQVQDRLHFVVVVEQVVVFDLGDFVDACLFRDELWSRWFRLEDIGCIY